MQTRKIGVLDVSVVGLGCNNFGMMIDAERTRAVVDAAIDAGINYFDTAESYGSGQSEEFLGAALAGRRSGVLVATKWGHTSSLAAGERGGDPARIRSSLEASLRGSAPTTSTTTSCTGPTRHPARGHARGARRAAGGGQDPRDRLHLLLGRRAGRRRARRPPRSACRAIRRSRTSTAC